MTFDPRTASEVLDPAECWRLLAVADVGRLALVAAGEPEIFPVNFVVDEGTLLFRTAEGTKLAAVATSYLVALEIDGVADGGNQAWSVVAKGPAERLDRFVDIYAADDVPLFSWNVAPKPVFVRIRPASVSGRRFTVLPGRGDDER